MKKIIALAMAACAMSPVLAATNVGVSIGINQPGVYGRVDIGNYPQQPVLVYPEPVIIAPQPVTVHRRPIYLYVPPAHQHNWGRYCGRYQACGQPVYFVQEQWVRDRYQQEHRGWRDRRDDRRDDRHDHHDKHDHGKHGRGHGHGHSHGRD